MNTWADHPFVAQPRSRMCVCGLLDEAHPSSSEREVDALGRLFAKILDKREGKATQAEVDERVGDYLAAARAARVSPADELVRSAPSETTETEP